MLARISERLSGWLVMNGLPEGERPVYAYGIQMAIEITLNIVSTLLIGLLMGCVVESMVFLAGYSLLRSYTGGLHMETAIGCYISSCGLITGVLILSKAVPESRMWYIIPLVAIASAVIFLLSPVPATHKPLDEVETVRYRKQSHIRLCLILAVLAGCYLFRQTHLAFVLASAVCLVSLFMILGIAKNQWYQHRGESGGR